ncbi:MAG: site-specific DNA-methyltransferase [Planctomycetaceae bacterium]|nr:site-specific DNA-methyltransferase [Planctomycetaceae bacterium]
MPTLDWIGKKAVLNHHRVVPYHLLKCDQKLSVGDPGSGNLLVQGDNLLALKALLPYYAGRVKCIYIDPPYNTGNENWVYNDAVNSPEIRKWLGRVVGAEAEDLSRHDKWLCMMYPRLMLLREFLRSDGAIFVSIDDGELHHLRALMDEVFGPRNFIATIVWQKKQSPQNDAINLSDMHDYLVVYAKRAKQNRDDPHGWNRNLLPREATQDARYSNPDNDPRGPWTSADYTCNKTADERPNLFYAITHPVTREQVWPSRRRVWAFDEAGHERNVRENRVWWGPGRRTRPRVKKFLCEVREGVVPTTWWTREFAGDNQEARRELRAAIADEQLDFQTPKPARLVKRILEIAAGKDSLVLDSFAGSGTTGHAVLGLNKADGGSRRFILVEMEEAICQTVTAQRLTRAIEGHNDLPALGGGFRYCRLGPTIFDETGNIRAGVTFGELAAHVYFAETGEPLPKRTNGKTPLLGVHNSKAIYLLFNGVLGDRSAGGGNVLTSTVLRALPAHSGPRIIYGEGCRLGPARLKRERIVFKQIPYGIKVS